MKILSPEAFVKKISQAVKKDVKPTIEVRPNWQLLLSVTEDDGNLGRFLGPSPDETGQGGYTIFLSEVDTLAGSRFAVNWVIDGMRS